MLHASDKRNSFGNLHLSVKSELKFSADALRRFRQAADGSTFIADTKIDMMSLSADQ